LSLAALLMLVWAHLVRRLPLPAPSEYKTADIRNAEFQYLPGGIFVGHAIYHCGPRHLSLALESAADCHNKCCLPEKKVGSAIWTGLLLGIAGVGIVTFPVLQNSTATPLGAGLLFGSMISYSLGTVYFSGIPGPFPDWLSMAGRYCLEH
jgi:hypothetical protein